MRPVIFRFGMYATLSIVALGAIHFFIVMPNVSMDTAEVAGYLTMILSMVFVFMGIRYYRDRFNNGFLRFGEGLKIGVLIVLIPSVFFGLFDLLYTEVLHPSWADEYMKYYIDKINASNTPEVARLKLDKLHKDMEMFSNPVVQFLIMAATVFIIGLIVTIISSLTLMRKRGKQL